jgi:hypothetical protein
MNDEAKYAAACEETVARIEARDRVLEGFVTLAAAIVALSLSDDKFAMFGVSVGYTALAAALLSRHHDVIIGLLGSFQNELCANDDKRLNWFSDEYFHDVLRERGYRDISLALIFAGGGIFGLGSAWKVVHLGELGELKTIVWYSGAACLIASFGILYSTYRTRQALHERIHRHRKK